VKQFTRTESFAALPYCALAAARAAGVAFAEAVIGSVDRGLRRCRFPVFPCKQQKKTGGRVQPAADAFPRKLRDEHGKRGST
jgi:hypothetical protein